jgi:hypothetical protein
MIFRDRVGGGGSSNWSSLVLVDVFAADSRRFGAIECMEDCLDGLVEGWRGERAGVSDGETDGSDFSRNAGGGKANPDSRLI